MTQDNRDNTERIAGPKEEQRQKTERTSLLPYPLGLIYRDIIIREELNDYNSYYEITRFSDVLLKYLATIIISDYLEHVFESSDASRDINRSILDYFDSPEGRNAHTTIKKILAFYQKNRLSPKISSLDVLMEGVSGEDNLPDFISARFNLIDLFLYLFRLERELDKGSFVYSDPGHSTFSAYLKIIEHLISKLMPLLEIELRAPVLGQTFNSYLAQGTTLKASNTIFKGGEEFLEENHLKPGLVTGPATLYSLYPLIFITPASAESHSARGRVLFLHRASKGRLTYIDYVSRQEFDAADIYEPIIPLVNNVLKRLQAESPLEKRSPLSPIVNYDEFFKFHKRYYIDRTPLRKEVEGFIFNNNRYYGLLTGENGVGKTAFLVNFVTEKQNLPIIYHFIRRTGDIDKPSSVLRSLIGRMMKIMRYSEDARAEISDDLEALTTHFNSILSETASYCKTKLNQRLVLIIDGIDNSRDPSAIINLLPDSLPDNSIAILSLEISEETARPFLDVSRFGRKIRDFTNCPIKGFTEEEILKYLKKVGFGIDKKSVHGKLLNRIWLSTLGGNPYLMRLLIDTIRTGAIHFDELIRLDDKPEEMSMLEWKRSLQTDSYYLAEVMTPLYQIPRIEGEANPYFSGFILGIITLLQHQISDRELANLFRCDVQYIKKFRRPLNKFVLREGDRYTFRHNRIADAFSNFHTVQDYIHFHRLIINHYEVTTRYTREIHRNSKAFSTEALSYLPDHYFKLGELTGSYQGLWDLESDNEFRVEQGLRVGVNSILHGLKLAIDSSIETNTVSELMKFGFLYNDIKTGGIKRGLSMIVSQAVEGNFNEALDLIQKIPNNLFRYKQLLFLAMLLARRDDFLNCADVLDEALIIGGATFDEEDEDLIFKIVESLIGIGIPEGLDILRTGIDEERMVRYYSRLADFLSEYQDLIVKIATGASMQLRKISDEDLKGRFIQEFARIVIGLKSEVKKWQFFEGLVYEARNLEDETVKIKTFASLAQIVAGTDPERSRKIFDETLQELEGMGTGSPLRFKLESHIAGKVAQLGFTEWSSELIRQIVDNASNLMISDERADVYQTVSRATIHLEDPGLRAELLELVFLQAEKLENVGQQTKVMTGISEVLSDSDEDAELLNIYTETFSYIDELPLDTAAAAIERVALNLKVVRDEKACDNILAVISDLVRDLSTPEEKSGVIIATARGLTASKHLNAKIHSIYIKGLVGITNEIASMGEMKIFGEILAQIAGSVVRNNVEDSVELIHFVLQRAKKIEDEEIRFEILHEIGDNLHHVEKADDIESIYKVVESHLREGKHSKVKANALVGLVKGIVQIPRLVIREKYIEKLIYLAENLRDGRQAYRVLSALSGGLLKLGEERWAVELYEKALSMIPLKEEKAPDALGGVMAGLCRGLAGFADQKWARGIYKGLIDRLEFIAPEKKKVQVLGGVVDGLEALESRGQKRNYFEQLIDVIENVVNRREKVIGFHKLTGAFLSINEHDQSKRMWERVISISTALDNEESGELKAKTLADAIIALFQFGGDWLQQAYDLTLQGMESLPAHLLAVSMEEIFTNIEKVSLLESQKKVIDSSISLIEKLEEPDDIVLCIQALSKGINHLGKGTLLKEILDSLISAIKKFKQGTLRVRAMAVISESFIRIGKKEWAESAYKRIYEAYGSVKDPAVRSLLICEMARIPLLSNDEGWQKEVIDRIFDRELSGFDEENQTKILAGIAEIIPMTTRLDWSRKQLFKIREVAGQLGRESIHDIYHAIFRGLAAKGDVETIFLYRESFNSRKINDISSQYLEQALIESINIDFKQSLSYYRKMSFDDLKSPLIREFFDKLMENRDQFEEEEFRGYYYEFLKRSIDDRDLLDSILGKVISFSKDAEELKKVAESLGFSVMDLATAIEEIPETEEIEKGPMVPTQMIEPERPPMPGIGVPAGEGESAAGAVADPAEALFVSTQGEDLQKPRFELPSRDKSPLDLKRILPTRKQEEEEAPMELSGVMEETVEESPQTEDKETETKSQSPFARKGGLLHRRSPVKAKKSSSLPLTAEITGQEDITDLLKYGYRLVKAQYFGEAAKYFTTATKRFPEDPRGLLGLAATQYMLKDYPKAARYYIEAVTIDPESDLTEKFIKVVPKNTYIWYDFAKSLYKQRAYKEASKFCDLIKSEGVYFDFIKRVDELKSQCLEEKERKEEPVVKHYTKHVAWAALIIFLLAMIGPVISWIYNAVGSGYLKEGPVVKQKFFNRERTLGDRDQFEDVTEPYRQAVKYYEKVNPSFLPGVARNTMIYNKAKARYETALYLKEHQFIPYARIPDDVVINEALAQRRKAISELEDLLRDDVVNHKAQFLLGMCHLANATDSQRAMSINGIDREAEFKNAVRWLSSAAENSGGSSAEYYLQLGIAYVEYYLSSPTTVSTALVRNALDNFEKAELIDKDPRIEVFRIAAYAILNRPRKALISKNNAITEVESAYAKKPLVQKYWIKLIDRFARLI